VKLKKLFVLIFSCVSLIANAQEQGFNEYYGIYMDGYIAKDLSKMKQGSELLIKNLPDEFAGYNLHAFYQLCAGDFTKAQQEINKAFNIEPLSPYPYMIQSYLYFMNGNTELAQKNVIYTVQLRSHKSLDDFYDDLDILTYFTKKDFLPFRKMLGKLSNEGIINPELALAFDQCFIGTMKGTPCSKIDELGAKFNGMSMPNPIINKIIPLVKAINFYTNGNVLESKNQFETFLNTTKADPLLFWQRSYAYWFLSILKSNNLDERGALVAINSALEEYKNLGFSSYQLANMQLHKIQVLGSLGDKQEKLQTAFQLEQTANSLNNNYYKAKAYNSIGAYYLMDGSQAEISKSGEYLTKAYNLAKAINDVPLIREVNSNYVIIKARQGLYADAEQITEETAQGYLKDKKYNQAQKLYNNIGFICFNKKEYKKAIGQFEKSIALAEKVKLGLNAKQKLEYMSDVAGVYTGLVMSYKYTGGTEKLFSLQEQSRSGYLKDLLKTNTATATISEAQNLLKTDEVLLTYTIGRPGEIIITAITKDKAEIRYNYPVDELLRLKKNLYR
jgi:tetratricopeptide (TPR) repeat protein